MNANTPTPHNEAKAGDFAPTVLLPGDPLRAKYVAETYLTDARLVNNVRGVQGHTGLYKGKPVSVMGSGMGMPAVGIYAHELFNFYGVENIIRIGTAGAVAKQIGMRDITASMSASTESSFGFQYGFAGHIAPTASFKLLSAAAHKATELGITLHVGPTYCSDVFYHEDARHNDVLSRMGILSVEMESAALYLTAMRAAKHALTLATVVDNPYTGEAATPEDREKSLHDMITLALEIA